jgi:hypothetical protein
MALEEVIFLVIPAELLPGTRPERYYAQSVMKNYFSYRESLTMRFIVSKNKNIRGFSKATRY